MMQVIPKWKVTVTFERGRADVVFWIHTAYLSNVLRAVADMQFTQDGLEQPTSITVSNEPYPEQQGVYIPNGGKQ